MNPCIQAEKSNANGCCQARAAPRKRAKCNYKSKTQTISTLTMRSLRASPRHSQILSISATTAHAFADRRKTGGVSPHYLDAVDVFSNLRAGNNSASLKFCRQPREEIVADNGKDRVTRTRIDCRPCKPRTALPVHLQPLHSLLAAGGGSRVRSHREVATHRENMLLVVHKFVPPLGNHRNLRPPPARGGRFEQSVAGGGQRHSLRSERTHPTARACLRPRGRLSGQALRLECRHI